MRKLIIESSMLLYAFLAFFGLGPVIFADGTMKERIVTACITFLLMFGLTVATKGVLEKFPKLRKESQSKTENQNQETES